MSFRSKLENIKDLSLSIELEAPIDFVWNEMVNWEKQSEWMLATKVYDDHISPTGVGHKIKAFTGFFPRRNSILGVMDHMVVSEWNPPYFCRVEHVGKIIKGYGTFTLSSSKDGKTQFDWFERIEAPALIVLLIRPGILLGVRFSLYRFKREVMKALRLK
jgi:hypothetical protein